MRASSLAESICLVLMFKLFGDFLAAIAALGFPTSYLTKQHANAFAITSCIGTLPQRRGHFGHSVQLDNLAWTFLTVWCHASVELEAIDKSFVVWGIS